MRKIIFFLFNLSILFVSPVLATPPTSIDLAYNADSGSLHVEAIHPSFNLDKSYVRLMNVYLNGAQVSTTDYTRQTDNNKFTDDVNVQAKDGDVIKVELFCSLGGSMSKELTVGKKDDAAQSSQGADSSSDTNASDENAVLDNKTN